MPSHPTAASSRPRRLGALLLTLLVSAAATALLSAGLALPASAAESTSLVRLTSGGLPRAYLLRTSGVPAPRPLVLALHGRYQTPTSMAAFTGLEGLADRAGFVLALPSARAGGWNAGGCCAGGVREQVPDVAFLDDVVTDVATRVPVDLHRVYVLGFSNGGMMAYRYACARGGRVAGIGVVGATMVATHASSSRAPLCAPARPVALAHVHGALDTTVRERGGYQGGLGTHTAPVATAVRVFAAAARCQGSGLQRVGTAVKRTFGGCATRSGRGVQLVRVGGMRHHWTRPGSGFDTTLGLWRFLAPHRAPDPLVDLPTPDTASPTASPSPSAEPSATPTVTSEPTVPPEPSAAPSVSTDPAAPPTAEPTVTGEPSSTASPETTAAPASEPSSEPAPAPAPAASESPTQTTAAPSAQPAEAHSPDASPATSHSSGT